MAKSNTMLLRYEDENVQPEALASGDVLAPTCSTDGRFTYYLNLAHPEKIRRISGEDGSTIDIADVLGDTVFGSLTISSFVKDFPASRSSYRW